MTNGQIERVLKSLGYRPQYQQINGSLHLIVDSVDLGKVADVRAMTEEQLRRRLLAGINPYDGGGNAA